MRHCHLVIEDGRESQCLESCHDHGSSFEGMKNKIVQTSILCI
jgi:hypothetical protein